MITKKELREIKDLLKQVSDKIEALQLHTDYDKLVYKEYTTKNGRRESTGYSESASLIFSSFLPRLSWLNKRLDQWIDAVPAGKRGKNKPKEPGNSSSPNPGANKGKKNEKK